MTASDDFAVVAATDVRIESDSDFRAGELFAVHSKTPEFAESQNDLVVMCELHLFFTHKVFGVVDVFRGESGLKRQNDFARRNCVNSQHAARLNQS